MSKKKLSKEGLENILQKFISYAEEERELALERYRRQDEMMQTPEDFVLQGKNAVDFLKTASARSDSLLNAAKMIKDVMFIKNEAGGGDESSLNDEVKKQILKTIKEGRE